MPGKEPSRAAPVRAARGTIKAMEQHAPPRRPKRSKDPIRAAWEVFQEVIGEKPREPQEKTPEHPPEIPSEHS